MSRRIPRQAAGVLGAEVAVLQAGGAWAIWAAFSRPGDSGGRLPRSHPGGWL